MERPFRVDEIMLEDSSGSVLSGCVLGTVALDVQWGVIEAIHGHAFEFRDHHTDCPVTLDASARRAAMEIVEAAFALQPDVVESAGLLQLSGRRPSMQMAQDSAGQRTLAKFLSSAKPARRWSVRRAE